MTSPVACLVALVALLPASACTVEFVDHQNPGDERSPDAGYRPDGAAWPPADAAGGAPDAVVRVPDAAVGAPDGGGSSPDAASGGAVCGDGWLDIEQGEQCDTGSGASTADCDADCTLPACGDGFLNRAAGEACEPGMAGCTSACTYGAPVQLVPTLTGPGDAGAGALCSSEYAADYACWQAFDASLSQWISGVFDGPAWVGYTWTDGPRTVVRYAILFANGSLTSRAPLDFALEGFDGTTWVTVDRRKDQRDWRGTERREYAVAAPCGFDAYRLRVIDDNDEREGLVVTSIARLELIGFQ